MRDKEDKMQVGIERISFYTPPFYLPLATLAKARSIPKNKFVIGLGQEKMAVIPPDESVVSMAANAAEVILLPENKAMIDTLLFATESAVDQSKAAGIFVHSLLDLPKNCRVIELKQACYSATAGLQMATAMLQQNPNRKILLLASDVARYGLQTPGEPSHGGGAVAMLLSNKTDVMAIETGSGLYTSDVMDFWRPNYRDEALVEGKYSCEMYLKALLETWSDYQKNSARDWNEHQHFLYHTPFPRLAEKAHAKLYQQNNATKPSKEDALITDLEASLNYSRITGNCYTCSLYVCLISLLDNSNADLANQRIGLYSYGSGCVAEYFSGVIQPDYQKVLQTKKHQTMLANRKELSITEYEQFYRYHNLKSDANIETPQVSSGKYRFAGIKDHKRIYQQRQITDIATAKAPGKLFYPANTRGPLP